MTENERQAATIKVTISNHVATAALGVIAGGAALYTYISQNYEAPTAFHALMLLSVGALVLSIICGGFGSNALANKLASGEWTGETRLLSFNRQALLTLLGLVLVLVATAVGVGSDRQRSGTDTRLDALSREAGALRVRLQDQSEAVRQLKDRVGRLQARRSRP